MAPKSGGAPTTTIGPGVPESRVIGPSIWMSHPLGVLCMITTFVSELLYLNTVLNAWRLACRQAFPCIHFWGMLSVPMRTDRLRHNPEGI